MRPLVIFFAALLCIPAWADSSDVDWSKETAALLDKAISDDPGVAIPARDEILETGRPCVPALREALKDKGVAKRFMAAELLGEIHDPAAAGDLAGLLDDLSEERTGEPVAAAAARALGKLGDASVGDKLIAALESKDVNVKYEAARALGNLRVKAAEAKLLEMLKQRKDITGHPEMSKETFRGGLFPAALAEALGKLKSVAAEKELVDMLEQPVAELLSGWSYDQIAVRALERITGETRGSWIGKQEGGANKELDATKQAWREWWAKQPKPPESPK